MGERSKYINKITLVLLGVFLFSCEKLDETGFLDISYHNVSDVKQYCQGACENLYDWENHDIGIMGNIPGITDETTMQEYKDAHHFYLSDIRSGIILEVKIQEGLIDIFDTLVTLQKTDMIFVNGIARPIVATVESSCEKGVYIDLYGLENVEINIQ